MERGCRPVPLNRGLKWVNHLQKRKTGRPTPEAISATNAPRAPSRQRRCSTDHGLGRPLLHVRRAKPGKGRTPSKNGQEKRGKREGRQEKPKGQKRSTTEKIIGEATRKKRKLSQEVGGTMSQRQKKKEDLKRVGKGEPNGRDKKKKQRGFQKNGKKPKSGWKVRILGNKIHEELIKTTTVANMG